MNRFRVCYKVKAPVDAVAEFHQQPQAMRKLTPRPLYLQVHRVDPLGENSIAEFTLWHGLFPVRWMTIQTDVDFKRGFISTQVHGPLLFWQHALSFCALSPQLTLVCEDFEYQHRLGLRYLWTRLVYSPLPLWILCLHRKRIVRREVRALARKL